MRPIDADKLKAEGYALHRLYQKDANTMVYEVKKIADVPTIEAEPVRRGWWLPFNAGDNKVWFACSRCYVPNAWKANYCPACGSRMEEQVTERLKKLPSVEPTMYGYSIEHLAFIAHVLQREDIPPEKIVDLLTDIGRVVKMIADEQAVTIRKAMEQWRT